MPPGSTWPVPFILEPQHLEIGSATFFCLSVLLAVLINAEAQAFMANLLGDVRQDAKDRFHFNAFLHLSVLGTICYLVGGFGWPRPIEVDAAKFAHPRTYMVITRFAGAVANLLLAGIFGSLVSFMHILQYDPRGLLMVVGVNVTTAVYQLIILPPLAGGVLVCELLPSATARHWFSQAGPFAVLALALLERLQPQGIVSPYLNPIITAIFNYIKS